MLYVTLTFRKCDLPLDRAETQRRQWQPTPVLLKSAIKDAILDGVIPNEHDAAFAYMLEKAKKMGLTPKA